VLISYTVCNYLLVFIYFPGLYRYVLCNRSRFIWTFLHESKNWCLSKQQRTDMEPGMLNVLYLSVMQLFGLNWWHKSLVEALQSVVSDLFCHRDRYDEMRWCWEGDPHKFFPVLQSPSQAPEPPARPCNLARCRKRWLKPRF